MNMTKNVLVIVLGIICFLKQSNAFLGLSANIPFAFDIAASLRSISTSYTEMVRLVSRIEDAKNQLNIDSVRTLKNNLQIIREGLQTYKDYTQKFAGYAISTASLQAAQIVAELNADFVNMPALSTKLRTAMGVLDTLTKSTLVTLLPADGDMTAANTVFVKIMTAITGLIGKSPMSSSIILASLVQADISAYTTFLNNHVNLAKQQVDQFKNILEQFEKLRNFQRIITNNVINLINFKTFNNDVAYSINIYETRMNDALKREVTFQKTAALPIERKLNASSNYDENNKIPDAVTNLNLFLTKLDASSLEATTAISAAMVVFKTFGKGLEDTSKTDLLVKELITAVSLRIFSKSSVLAIRCTDQFERQFVNALKVVGTENTDCLKDTSNILPWSYNFFASKLDMLRVIITDKLNLLPNCINLLTARTSKTRILMTIDGCLTTGAAALVSSYTEIQTVITAMITLVKNDLTAATTDYTKCSLAANTFYTGNFTKNLALFDTCSTYTGA